MQQFKLGQHNVRFEISEADASWKLTQCIGLQDVWDDPTTLGEYRDRRKAKNAMNRYLKQLRTDPSYY